MQPFYDAAVACVQVDVILENFRPGVLEGWGLGPKDLKKGERFDFLISLPATSDFSSPSRRSFHPELIFTRISGYGQTGPKAKVTQWSPRGGRQLYGIPTMHLTPFQRRRRRGMRPCLRASVAFGP